MCDSSIEEDLERYRRNNVELAVALNELKAELNIVQMELLQRNRELQKVHNENATLKHNLAQKDTQISTWRSIMVDLVTSNTRKYTEVMQKLGLVPAAHGTTKPKEQCVVKTENTMSTTSKLTEQNVRTNVQKRPKNDYDDSPDRLPDLTEESIHSQFNESKTPVKSPINSPEKSISHVTARRCVSIPPRSPASPVSPQYNARERLISNGETKGKKPTDKIRKMEKIIDENTPINGATGRPTRRTAPKNLSEPKLGTKLRRN